MTSACRYECAWAHTSKQSDDELAAFFKKQDRRRHADGDAPISGRQCAGLENQLRGWLVHDNGLQYDHAGGDRDVVRPQLSPTLNAVTPAPTASITPTPSWPRMVPGLQLGTSPLRMCRSVPQMVVLVTLTITSVGDLMDGLERSCSVFWPGPL